MTRQRKGTCAFRVSKLYKGKYSGELLGDKGQLVSVLCGLLWCQLWADQGLESSLVINFCPF